MSQQGRWAPPGLGGVGVDSLMSDKISLCPLRCTESGRMDSHWDCKNLLFKEKKYFFFFFKEKYFHLCLVWLQMFLFFGILASPLGFGQKVTLLLHDGLLSQKFVLVQHWKKYPNPPKSGIMLKHPFSVGKAKTLPGASSRGSSKPRREAGEESGCFFIPKAIREDKYFLCASVSL